MEVILAFGVVMCMLIPLGIAASCEQSNQARSQQARYQCVKDGHTVNECKELFP